MKGYLIIILLLGLQILTCIPSGEKEAVHKISVKNSANKSGYELSISQRTDTLKKYFKYLPKLEAQKKYFDYFPSTFKDLKRMFGYEHIDKYNLQLGTLYENSGEYIDAFFVKVAIVPEKKKVKKIIDLSLDAQWQADGITIFQLYLQEDVQNKVITYATELAKKDSNQVLSFWHFYFSGPHPESYIDDFKILYKQYLNSNKRIAELMKQSYQQLLEKSDKHGH